MVIVEDENPERLEIAARMGVAPLATEKDLDQWCFLERLEDLIHDHPVDFTIPLTDRVNRCLQEHVRQ